MCVLSQTCFSQKACRQRWAPLGVSDAQGTKRLTHYVLEQLAYGGTLWGDEEIIWSSLCF